MRTALVQPTLPDAAREPCAAPVTLPDRDIDEREATSLWGRDRSNLRICETRRAAAVGALSDLGKTP